MNGWKSDKRWSDKFLPEVKRVLGGVLIGEAPQEEDQERNTDLLVLRMDPVRIACRIRRAGYFEDYGHQFTIRTDRPSGQKTELAKLVTGWGDYIFYGHAGDGDELRAWAIGDLNVFRYWFNCQIVKHAGKVPGTLKPNRDGSSEFRAFVWRDLPKEFVVASGGEMFAPVPVACGSEAPF